jgi:streptomycin 6-kinase
LIGEAEYGVIAFLMNNLPEYRPIDMIKRRVELFTKELALDTMRVLAWGYCHAVLSACWCLEDHVDGVEDALQVAEIFEKLLDEIN